MRFFLDTNVLASAFAFEGNDADLMQSLARLRQEGLVSPLVLAELEAVLREKIGLSKEESRAAIARARGALALVDAGGGLTADRRILADAAPGAADFLVTGDRALLRLKSYGRVAIVRAADALRILGLRPRGPKKGL